MLPGIYISSPGFEAGGALGSSSAMVEQGIKVCVCVCVWRERERERERKRERERAVYQH